MISGRLYNYKENKVIQRFLSQSTFYLFIYLFIFERDYKYVTELTIDICRYINQYLNEEQLGGNRNHDQQKCINIFFKNCLPPHSYNKKLSYS